MAFAVLPLVYDGKYSLSNEEIRSMNCDTLGQ